LTLALGTNRCGDLWVEFGKRCGIEGGRLDVGAHIKKLAKEVMLRLCAT
jgi:hypothetical protein